jgi:hypothetical protein
MPGLKSTLHQVFGDFLDRSAAKRKRPSRGVDLWVACGVALTTAAGYLESAEKVFIGVFGDFIGTFRLLLIIVSLVGCVFIVRSKTQLAKPFAMSSSFEYSFPQLVRILGKAGVIVLLVLLPSKFIAAKDDFVPLPRTLHGYLLYGKTGKALSDARIRVVTQDGVDVTDGNWFSDSKGFYIVRTRERVKRTAQIIISLPECQFREALRLRRIDQTGTEDGIPIFRHVADCDEHK